MVISDDNQTLSLHLVGGRGCRDKKGTHLKEQINGQENDRQREWVTSGGYDGSENE